MSVVWRLIIKTNAQPGIDPHQFCISQGILGVGWQVPARNPLDWDTYYKRGETAYYNKEGCKGWWPAVNAVGRRMQLNDLCWTRNPRGEYFLGRITSNWRYARSARHLDADVVNIRRCKWFRVGLVDAVPGKVVNSFIPNRALQVVDDETVSIYSQFLFNKLSGTKVYALPTHQLDLYSLLSSEDLEDIVGLYLQQRGFSVIPSSCKSHTASYEYTLRHRTSGREAIVQAKSGNVDLTIDDFASNEYDAYLFTSEGRYLGRSHESVHCLNRRVITRFLRSHHRVVPSRVATWLAIVEASGAKRVA